jgi:hypothetical protein
MRGKNKLILEFSEFNAMRLNPDSTQPGISVDNKQLSIDAFDKHQDAIRAGVSRINNILNTLSNTSQFRSLKSKLALEEQKITSLKVLRIDNKDNTSWDFYISFIIADEEYFGVIKNATSKNAEVTSEVFKDYDLIQSKEWVIRLKGLIIKTIKQWLRPEKGMYKLLNDKVICYSVEIGRMVEILKNSQVEVMTTFENKIVIKYKDEIYNLVNDNFVYFNYWFTKID